MKSHYSVLLLLLCGGASGCSMAPLSSTESEAGSAHVESILDPLTSIYSIVDTDSEETNTKRWKPVREIVGDHLGHVEITLRRSGWSNSVFTEEQVLELFRYADRGASPSPIWNVAWGVEVVGILKYKNGAEGKFAIAGPKVGFQDQTGQPWYFEWRTDGIVTTDDDTRLYYVERGSGPGVLLAPLALYLEPDLLVRLSRNRRVVLYDPRNRGRSSRADLSTISLDRQIQDLETLRDALGIEKMALLGWSAWGMEMAVYALRHPDRVTRLIQISPIPPAELIMREHYDARAVMADRTALEALDRRNDAGEFVNTPEEYCRLRYSITDPASFVDTRLAKMVPDVCANENEWHDNLQPYFRALFQSYGEYDWRDDLEDLRIPRLIIHGREDRIPLEGARAWAAGYPEAQLLVLSPSGHFPYIEQREAVIAAIETFLGGEWPQKAKSIANDKNTKRELR